VKRGHLATERRNASTAELDRLPVAEAIALIQDEDRAIHAALEAARPALVAATELVVERLARGGRLFYVGAGTSGRLGQLDAVECPPTFQSHPETVQAVIAGGAAALLGAVEGAEDDSRAGAEELAARDVGADDVVLGIAAGGTTPFVHGALAFARAAGAATVFLACVPADQVADDADVSIRIPTGPEVLTGSTRLKAGTATKLALNALTTVTFARLGKVHGNLMVDVNTHGNAKLVERGTRLVAELCEVPREEAAELLERADGSVKLAVVMRSLGLDAAAAAQRLEAHGGHLRAALEA
jgi:N-acetylmuramic acid 6-phosphate etherase